MTMTQAANALTVPDSPATAAGQTELPDLHQLTDDLALLRQEVLIAPGEDATERQHARGRLTARERIDRLCDAGSFREIEMFRPDPASGFGLDEQRAPTDGVITGDGTGDGHAQKIHKIMDLAESAGAPLIGLNDGAGARIQEGVTALAGYGGILRRNVRASGVIPQISVMLGPCAGGASYSPALTDFVFMVRGISNMFLTGPDVI